MQIKNFVKAVFVIMSLLGLIGCSQNDAGESVSAHLEEKYGISFEVKGSRNGTGAQKGGYTEFLCAPTENAADEFIVTYEDKTGSMRDSYADIWAAHELERILSAKSNAYYENGIHTKVILDTAEATYEQGFTIGEYLEKNAVMHIFPAIYIRCTSEINTESEAVSASAIADSVSDTLPDCSLWFYYVKEEQFSKAILMSGREKGDYIYALDSEDVSYNFTFADLSSVGRTTATQILADFER
jgi:hypothetical protein